MAAQDAQFDADDFCGRARVFPLPNLVFFPHALQPLHIFEPRYREMMEDALAGDRLIALAVLAPGWEDDYEGRPPVYPVACLGRVATYRKLDDGRYNLLLQGLGRVGLGEEIQPQRSFRMARAELLPDRYDSVGDGQRGELHARLSAAMRAAVERYPSAAKPFEPILNASVSLGTLTDLLAFSLDLSMEAKLRLLGELDVDRRAEMLAGPLEAALREPKRPVMPEGPFPPDFSAN